ncbi:MAG: LysE family translocator [Proteobacteria bacterium]|nr:LysE family translocator [Pseudomonadota bacterium]
MSPIAPTTFGLFVLACVALALTPGPNTLLLVSRTLAQGRRAGWYTLAGTQTGLAFHALLAAFGLSALLMAVPLAYDALRIAGALYLAWLAWQTWRARDAASATVDPDAGAPAWKLYRDGAITGIFNPKVALFELALLPQFVDPARGPVLVQTLLLGVTQVLVVLPFDAVTVLIAARVHRWFASGPSSARRLAWARRALATVFGALALRLVVDSRR